MASSTKRRGRVYNGLTAGARAARRRAQLIEAGLQVFGTVGFRGATVRGVCAQAGLTDRYFYESFEGMEDLLLAVYADCIAEFQAALEPVFARWVRAGDPRGGLQEGLDLFFSWVEDPRVARVVWQEVLGVSDRVDAAYAAVIHGFANRLLDVARAAGVDWTERPEAEMIAVGGAGALVQTAMQWRLQGYETTRAEVVAAAKRVLLGLATIPTAIPKAMHDDHDPT